MLFQQSRGCGRRAGADPQPGGDDIDAELPALQLAGDDPAARCRLPASAGDPGLEAAAVAQQLARLNLGQRPYRGLAGAVLLAITRGAKRAVAYA
jgi:hypothetical protein